MSLSKHFTFKELTRSQTARKNGLRNIPEDWHLENLKALCDQILEPIRQIFDAPVIITSGFRCATLNRLIGGAAQSQHTLGEAADFIVKGKKMIEVAVSLRCLDGIPFDQMIYEVRLRKGKKTEWIHISHKRHGDNRREVLTIVNKDGESKTLKGVHHYEDVLRLHCSE